VNYLEKPLRAYLEDAASGRPTPGGGSVSALAGALGVTMAEMAANFTLGREQFRDVAPEVMELLAVLTGSRSKFLDLMAKDIAAYSEVAAAYGRPRATPEEKAARAQAIQEALVVALEAPLATMRVAAEALAVVRRLVDVANPNLLSDVAVAAELVWGAVRGGRLNVDVNLAHLKDEGLVARFRREADALEAEARTARGETVDIVSRKLQRT
jgi:formiminotetrahydrofolate cyclodeaminase